MNSINWRPTNRELRQFAGIWFPLFWVIVGGVIVWRGGLLVAAGAIVAVAIGIGIVGLIRPRMMRPMFVGWMCAVFPIGWVVSHLLLAVVFYLVIAPLGLVMRFVGRDKLRMRFEPEARTYWTRRPPTPPASRYFRQF
jgi:hypothetical protein